MCTTDPIDETFDRSKAQFSQPVSGVLVKSVEVVRHKSITTVEFKVTPKVTAFATVALARRLRLMIGSSPTTLKIVRPKLIVPGGHAWNQDLRLHLLGSGAAAPFSAEDAPLNLRPPEAVGFLSMCYRRAERAPPPSPGFQPEQRNQREAGAILPCPLGPIVRASGDHRAPRLPSQPISEVPEGFATTGRYMSFNTNGRGSEVRGRQNCLPTVGTAPVNKPREICSV